MENKAVYWEFATIGCLPESSGLVECDLDSVLSVLSDDDIEHICEENDITESDIIAELTTMINGEIDSVSLCWHSITFINFVVLDSVDEIAAIEAALDEE